MAHPTEAEAQQEYDRIWSQLGTRAIEELIDLSAMTDRESLATLDVLTKLLIPALFTAAERAGRKRGSAGWLYAQPGVQERIAELKRIAKAANNRETAEQAIKVRRKIDIDRNDIVMGLVDIARSESEPGAVKVRAWAELVEIFLLKAKNLKELTEFYGWTSDEIEYFAQTGQYPERLRSYLGDAPSL
jgi:hypothetical protein